MMYVRTLDLTNVRAIESAPLEFRPGFNLVVGINGVGKTTVLDALAWSLSFVVKHLNGLKTGTREPPTADIRFGASALTVQCTVSLDDVDHTFLIHQPGEGVAVAFDGEGKPREQTHEVEPRREFLGQAPARVPEAPPDGRPLAVFFSTRRASAARSNAKPRKAIGGVAAAFASALEDRELVLASFADWMRAQKALSEERPESRHILEAFEAATQRFLPGYSNLRVEAHDGGHRLIIDQGESKVVSLDQLSDTEQAAVQHAIEKAEAWISFNWAGEQLGDDASARELEADRQSARAERIEHELAHYVPRCRNLQEDASGKVEAAIERLPATIPVSQLSDGERGTLAMVLELTRRLAQANPHLADPAKEAGAVVLIDEIDLHLHPRWQREVIDSLTTTFPRCQFIATTHSPLVISEVPHDRVQVMTPDGVHTPTHSFGIDSSRILEEVMEASPRPKAIEARLARISELARPGDVDEARAELEKLADELELGESDPEVTRLQTLLDFLGDA